MGKSSFYHSHCKFAKILAQNPSFSLEFWCSIVGGTNIHSMNHFWQWGKLLVFYLFMVQFFIFIGKILVFEFVLGVKFAFIHSRRPGTRGLQECIILIGGPKGTCKNLALFLKGTCKNCKVKNFFKVFSMKKIPSLEESCWPSSYVSYAGIWLSPWF